jgi:hypothetical protein
MFAIDDTCVAIDQHVDYLNININKRKSSSLIIHINNVESRERRNWTDRKYHVY